MRQQRVFYKFSILFFSVIFLTQIFTSCKKNGNDQNSDLTTLEEQKIETHKWFYFNQNNFEQIDYPENAPKRQAKPWTESVRIAAFGSTPIFYDQKNPDKKIYSYALVNRLGIIEFDNDKMNFYKDAILFDEVSCDSIVFMNDMPVFSMYKNSIFNENLDLKKNQNQTEPSPILVQFDKNAKTFFPIINAKSLKLKENSQISDFYFDGKEWFYCVKNSNDNRTNFEYIKWSAQQDLLSLLPNESEKKSKINLTKSSETEFRSKKTPADFSFAPERIKKLLSVLPNNFNFLVECKMQNGASPKYFSKSQKKSNSENSATATAILSEYFSACLFSDGTIYFSGALEGHEAINNFEPIAFRLPKLPQDFKYCDFSISGDFLYASWQESDFYEISRSGFLQVDLSKIFYNNSVLK